MKKSGRFATFVVVILALSVVGMGVNGTPWGLVAVKKDAARYLQERYAQEMVIATSKYSFTNGNYFVRAHPVGNEDLLFLVKQYEASHGSGVAFTDEYIRERWTYQIQSELQPVVQKIFSEKDSAFVDLYGDFLYDQFKDKKNITNEEIPTYQQVADTLIFGSRIGISVNREFDSEHADEEYRRILEVLNFVKSKQYPVGQVDFNIHEDYDYDDYDKVKKTYFDIPRDKWNEMKTIEDIKEIQRTVQPKP